MTLQRAPVEASVLPVAARPATDPGRLELPLAPSRTMTDPTGESVLAQLDQPAMLSPIPPESSLAVSSLTNASGARSDSTPAAPAVQAFLDPATISMSGLQAWAMPLRPQPAAGVPSAARSSAAAAMAVEWTAPVVAPLVGARPIATLQRSADSAAPAGAPRGAPAEAPGIALALTDEPGDRDEELFFADDPGQVSSPASVQRLLADTATDRPAATLTLQPRPKGTLTSAAEERPVDREAATGSSERTAWMTVMAGSSLQREPVEAAAGEAPGAVSAQPGGAASPNGSAPHLAANSRSADADMDALAGKLYDRIRSRLKTELLVDRERAGFLTDLR